MTSSKKQSSQKRQASIKSYEDKTDFKPLSVRVNNNRIDKVKKYAWAGKCPDYDY